MEFKEWLKLLSELLGGQPNESLDLLASFWANGLTPSEVVESCLIAA